MKKYENYLHENIFHTAIEKIFGMTKKELDNAFKEHIEKVKDLAEKFGFKTNFSFQNAWNDKAADYVKKYGKDQYWIHLLAYAGRKSRGLEGVRVIMPTGEEVINEDIAPWQHPDPQVPNANIIKLKKSVLNSFYHNKPLFVWGAPGIGKSSVMNQIAEQLQVGVIIYELAMHVPTDVAGAMYALTDTDVQGWIRFFSAMVS